MQTHYIMTGPKEKIRNALEGKKRQFMPMPKYPDPMDVIWLTPNITIPCFYY